MKYILLLILKILLSAGSLAGLLYLGKREGRKVRLVWLIMIPLLLFMFPIVKKDKETGVKEYWTPLIQVYSTKIDDFRSDKDLWLFPDNFRSEKEGFALNKIKSAEKFIKNIGNLSKVSFGKGTLLSYLDDRDGFHGDGLISVAVAYDDSDIAEKLKENTCWHRLPLDRKLAAGLQENPHINGNISVKHGYYFYAAENVVTSKYTVYEEGTELQTSNDYIIAIYDTDTGILYYWKVNT